MAKKILVVTPGCDALGHILPITEAQKAQLEDETMLTASGVSDTRMGWAITMALRTAF
jgi:hypothetical protein